MIITREFPSKAEAEGFIDGVEYLLSYCGESRGPLPRVVGECRTDEDGDRWWVDVEIPGEESW